MLSKEIKSKVLEITELALEIDEHDVFVEYSSHVELVVVRVYKGGYSNDKEAEYFSGGVIGSNSYDATYLDWENPQQNLDRIIQALRKLKVGEYYE